MKRLTALLFATILVGSFQVNGQQTDIKEALSVLKNIDRVDPLLIKVEPSTKRSEAGSPLIAESIDIGTYAPQSLELEGVDAIVSAFGKDEEARTTAGILVRIDGPWSEMAIVDAHFEIKRVKQNAQKNSNSIYLPLSTGELTYLIVSYSEEKPQFVLDKAYRYFQDISPKRGVGFGANLDCHVDVACPEAKDFQEDQQGAVRVFMVLEEGIGFCSGALMNNTAEDRTPYILSAYHCQDGYTPRWDEWRFDFMLSTVQCGHESTSPATFYLTGADEIAGDQADDFILLKLWDDLQPSLPVVYMGWDRSEDYYPDTVALIHHPMGDYKKVTFNFDGIAANPHPIFWNNGVETSPGQHFKCKMDLGSYESGSSGGPYVDSRGRVIGQLHGGTADCDEVVAYAGMLRRAWDGAAAESRLKDWLDPLNSGLEIMDPLYTYPVASQVQLNGKVLMGDDRPVPETQLYVSGTTLLNPTDGNGNFEIHFLDNGFDASISGFKDGSHDNGVNVLDLIATVKHIVGLQPFQSPVQEVAADVDGSGSVNVIDLILIQKLLVGLIDEFPAGPWGLYPAPAFVPSPVPQDFIIRAAKKGDVDYSADPGQ